MSKLHIELHNPCVDRSLSVYLLMRENLPWRHLWLHYFSLKHEDYARFIRFVDAASSVSSESDVASRYIHLWYSNLFRHPTEKARLFTSFGKIFHFKNNALLKLLSSNNYEQNQYEVWDCSVGTRNKVVGFGFRMVRRIPAGYNELSLDISPTTQDKFGLCPLLDYPERLNQLMEEILLQQTSLEEEWTSMKRISNIQNVLQLQLELPTVLVGTIMHYLPNVKISYYSTKVDISFERIKQ